MRKMQSLQRLTIRVVIENSNYTKQLIFQHFINDFYVLPLPFGFLYIRCTNKDNLINKVIASQKVGKETLEQQCGLSMELLDAIIRENFTTSDQLLLSKKLEMNEYETIKITKTEPFKLKHDDFISTVFKQKENFVEFNNLLLDILIENIWIGESFEHEILFCTYKEGEYSEMITKLSKFRAVRDYFCPINSHVDAVNCLDCCNICGKKVGIYKTHWHDKTELTDENWTELLECCQSGLLKYRIIIKISSFKDLITKGNLIL
jgi:hypothetical protein